MRLFPFPLRSRKDGVESQSPDTAKAPSAQNTPPRRHSLSTYLGRDSTKACDNPKEFSSASQPRRNVSKNSESAIAESISSAARHPPEMRKRRVVIPLYIVDNPYLTETEFVIDARYKRIREVGTGRFGVVVSAEDSETHQRVAIKKVMSAFGSTHAARHVLRELRLLRRLRHPHIVSLLDVDIPRNFRAWDAVYFVTPLLQTDLRSALLRGKLRDRRAQKRILAQILCALRHMHAANIMHRDLKSLNILLDPKLNAQICDLGEARFYSKTTDCADAAHVVHDTELTVGPRTVLHSAPELFLNEPYNSSIDVWGIGCIAAECIHPHHKYLFDSTKHNPMQIVVETLGYPSEEQMAHLEKRSSRWYMSLAIKRKEGGMLRKMLQDENGEVDEDGLDFVERCLKFSPKERMTAEEALKHPFLEEVAQEVIAEVEEKCEARDEGFDFQLTEPPESLSKTQLKDLVWNEVVAFHPEASLLGIH